MLAHGRCRALGALLVVAMVTGWVGCAHLSGREPTPEGPGVPKVLTARFEPDTVRAGQETTLVVTFEDTEGDLVQAFLIERAISDFRWVSTIPPIPIDVRRHLGEVVGTIRESFRWDAPSIRYYYVYVVDRKGQASNRLPVQITVR